MVTNLKKLTIEEIEAMPLSNLNRNDLELIEKACKRVVNRLYYVRKLEKLECLRF